MDKQTIKIISSIVLIFIVTFTIDSLFFKHLFWQRLIVNIGIVVVYAFLFYKYINKWVDGVFELSLISSITRLSKNKSER